VNSDSEGKIRGLQNHGLNDRGEEQAKELGEMFAKIPISAIYTDDLKRTYHTALAIAHKWNMEVKQDTALRSWDVGSDLEGRKIEANEDAIKEFKLQPDKIPVGGQSWADYEAQICAAFDKYVGRAMDAPNPIVLVLHGSGLQVIWEHLGAMEKSAEYDDTPLETSGVAAIYFSRDGLKVKALKGAKEMADA